MESTVDCGTGHVCDCVGQLAPFVCGVWCGVWCVVCGCVAREVREGRRGGRRSEEGRVRGQIRDKDSEDRVCERLKLM